MSFRLRLGLVGGFFGRRAAARNQGECEKSDRRNKIRTVQNRRDRHDPDLSIYGKTGTCSENGARLGWFMSYAGEPQSKYVAVVLLRGGRMMYGPHAAEVAGRFYRDLMQKEHPTQASREDSSTLASQR